MSYYYKKYLTLIQSQHGYLLTTEFYSITNNMYNTIKIIQTDIYLMIIM